MEPDERARKRAKEKWAKKRTSASFKDAPIAGFNVHDPPDIEGEFSEYRMGSIKGT